MTSQINGLNMAVRNANDAISMVTTEDGALIEVTNMLQRMRELAVQSASGTYGSTDRTALDTEFAALASEIQRVGSNTEFNGTKILDGSGVSGEQSFQVGANASQSIGHTFAVAKTADITSSTPSISNNQAAHTANSTVDQFTVSIDNGNYFAVGDTLTFTVEGNNYSANVDEVSSGVIQKFTFHGESTQITLAGTENFVIDTATLDANDATTSPAGAIKVNLSNSGLSITFDGTLAHDDADFDVALVSTYSDGSTATNGTTSRGIVAGVMFADITTVKGATSALKTLDHAIDKVNTARSNSGAVTNRLEYAADNLANVSQNTSASRSRILDADYASETTELARTQIIQQAATAMLSQANQQAQSVLALLK
tara:strand:- start:54 stop:1166 length:1113 start_codon:yes stop_codon:yes gene_type:complete